MSEIKAYTDDWLKARKLGSSDAAAILGLNPYRTPYQVWLEKTSGGSQEETEPMRWGKLLEPIIAEEFSNRTKLAVARNESMATHPEHDFLTATVDYWCWENDVLGILEIKNVNAFSREYDDSEIADYTQIQVMHQLAVTGLQWAYVAYLKGGNKLQWQVVRRDERLIEHLVKELAKFWKLVEAKTPPPMSGGDNDLLAEMFPTSNKNQCEIPAMSSLAAAYIAAKQEAKAAQSRADDYAAKMKKQIGFYESVKAGSFRVSWKEQERAEHVVKASKFRKFDVKEIKNG